MQHSHTASRWITRTALGVALVVVAQLLGKVIPAGAVIAGPFSVTQLVTGSLVNCVLFVFTATTGIWSGVAIGILSSVLATLIGIGPAIPAVTPVIACGNASLTLMFDYIGQCMMIGCGDKPWSQQGKIKFIAVVPGYDRHFTIAEYYGIELINVPIHEDGPDMDMVEKLIQDPSVKGMC